MGSGCDTAWRHEERGYVRFTHDKVVSGVHGGHESERAHQSGRTVPVSQYGYPVEGNCLHLHDLADRLGAVLVSEQIGRVRTR